MSALQEALERRRKHVARTDGNDSPYYDHGWNGVRMQSDLALIANDYLLITDPTPIDEAGLRAACPTGRDGTHTVTFTFPGLEVVFYRESSPYLAGRVVCCALDGAGFVPHYLAPRTAGEFEQLLRRVNG